MKLLLCSEGFRTPNTVQACVELVGKPQDQISIAVINEAYAVEDGDKYWVIDTLNDVARNFTGGIDILNLLALPLKKVEEKIMRRDAMFVVGGSTDYLMHVFNRTGFSSLLPTLLEKVVYIGSSAGSMVMGERLPVKAHDILYGDEETYGIENYLQFVPKVIIPHLDSPYFAGRSELLPKAAKYHQGVVCGLTDDSALVVNGTEQTVIGSAPVTFVNGRRVA